MKADMCGGMYNRCDGIRNRWNWKVVKVLSEKCYADLEGENVCSYYKYVRLDREYVLLDKKYVQCDGQYVRSEGKYVRFNIG
jgi:DNA-binding protein Fis